MKTDEQKKKKVLSKFTILCWAPFIAILGLGLDPLGGKKAKICSWHCHRWLVNNLHLVFSSQNKEVQLGHV